MGIFPPEKIINEITKIQNQLKKSEFLKAKFIDPEKLHITLAFIPKVKNSEIDEIIKSINEIKFKQFHISLDSIELIKKNKIIWIKIISEELNKLAHLIHSKLKKFIKKEERTFPGHITIARTQNILNKKLEKLISEIEINQTPFKINKIDLIQSTLNSNGSIYDLIQSFHFNDNTY